MRRVPQNRFNVSLFQLSSVRNDLTLPLVSISEAFVSRNHIVRLLFNILEGTTFPYIRYRVPRPRWTIVLFQAKIMETRAEMV